MVVCQKKEKESGNGFGMSCYNNREEFGLFCRDISIICCWVRYSENEGRMKNGKDY